MERFVSYNICFDKVKDEGFDAVAAKEQKAQDFWKQLGQRKVQPERKTTEHKAPAAPKEPAPTGGSK